MVGGRNGGLISAKEECILGSVLKGKIVSGKVKSVNLVNGKVMMNDISTYVPDVEYKLEVNEDFKSEVGGGGTEYLGQKE